MWNHYLGPKQRCWQAPCSVCELSLENPFLAPAASCGCWQALACGRLGSVCKARQSLQISPLCSSPPSPVHVRCPSAIFLCGCLWLQLWGHWDDPRYSSHLSTHNLIHLHRPFSPKWAHVYGFQGLGPDTFGAPLFCLHGRHWLR